MKLTEVAKITILFGMMYLTLSAQIKDQGNGNIGTESNKFNGAGNIAFGENNKFNGHYNLDIGDNNLISGSLNIASGDGNLIQGNGNLVSGEGNLVLSPNDVNMNEIMKKFNSDALANQIQSRLGMMGNGMFGNQQSFFYTQPMIPTQVNTNYMQNSINSLKPGQSIGSQNYQQQQNYQQPQQNYQQSQSYQPQQTYQNPVNNNLINQNLQNLLSSPKYNNNQNMGSFNNFNNGMNPQQQSSSLYSSIPQYFYQNPLYASGQGTYWASFGGSPNYVVDPVIGQIGGYQQQYFPYGSNVYQQPQYYGYQQQQQQVSYQGQYQPLPQYYQQFNQQYIPQVVYPQMNPYQQQQQQSYQPLQQQSYQQSQYAQQPTIVQQNNLRANNDLNSNNNNNHQNSYMNL